MGVAMEEKLEKVGEVSDYYSKIGVAIVKLTATISVGDKILIRGSTTSLRQTVNSIQIEHKNVTKAGAGQSIGLKVDDRVREGDTVYKSQ